MKEKSKTAKCPDCGNKYLVATGYCVSCKKKVAEPKKENIIEIQEQLKIDQENEVIILEKGDRIEVLKEDSENLREELVMPIIIAINNYLNNNAQEDWKKLAIDISGSVEDAIIKNPSFSHSAYDMLSKIGRILK